MTDICCIGHITRDKIITQRPPNTVYCAGGSAFYIAWALQALPQKVSFHMITSRDADNCHSRYNCHQEYEH